MVQKSVEYEIISAQHREHYIRTGVGYTFEGSFDKSVTEISATKMKKLREKGKL